MDENSCENETEESVDDKEKKKAKTDPHVQDFEAKLSLHGKTTRSQVSNRCGSSIDAQGPSTNFPVFPHIQKESSAGQALTDNLDFEEPVRVEELSAQVEETEKVQELDAPAGEIVQRVKELASPAAETEQKVQEWTAMAAETEQRVQEWRATAAETEQRVQEWTTTAAETEQRVQECTAPVAETVRRVHESATQVEEIGPGLQQPVERSQERGTTAPNTQILVPIQNCTELTRETGTLIPSSTNLREALIQTVPITTEELSAKRPSVGPPPSYSFVMKQKKKLKPVPSPDIIVTNRSPPPNYAGTGGFYITSQERTFGLPSFAEPIWRSHSQPALCPRCGIIVLTTAHSHESIATHVAALALCLFGCWPCCLLPYCMNVCKNTYHYCPICQAFLGLYTPW